MAIKLDMDKLKQRMAGKVVSSEKKESVLWTPTLPKGEKVAEYLIHLLPWQDQEGDPFKQRYFYFNLSRMKDEKGWSFKDKNGKFIKAPLTLEQFGEEDPVRNLINRLYSAEGKTEEQIKEDREACKLLYPNASYYVPVIVKDDEDLGPRLWKFSSKDIYERLCALFMQHDKIGMLHDPECEQWLRLKVALDTKKPFPLNKKVYPPDANGWEREPLSNDQEQIEKWCASVPNLDDAVAEHKYDTEELKRILNLFLDSNKKKEDNREELEEHTSKAVEKVVKKAKSSKKKEMLMTEEEAVKKLDGDDFDDEFDDDDDDDFDLDV